MRRPLLLTCLLTIWVASTSIEGSALARQSPMTVKFIVGKVAGRYGEAKPHIIHVESTQTDSTPHEAMYVIRVSGRFRRGHAQAHYLYFSALETRWYVWGIQGYDVRHRLLWIDNLLPKHVKISARLG